MRGCSERPGTMLTLASQVELALRHSIRDLVEVEEQMWLQITRRRHQRPGDLSSGVGY